MAARSDRVCLVLDEVHEIPSGSDGSRVLARLLAELPRNGHVVLASRVEVPVPVAVHASRRELERIVEADLVFDESELAVFAEARGVDVAVLSSSGGWPAVAELAATAGTDLVFEYVWEEVLATIGEVRACQLARFAVAGGGDDAVAAAVVPEVGGVEDLVAGLPLVARTGVGWVTLHPLWGPVLRGLLTAEEADESRCAAAVVHREAGRYDQAVSLFAESQAWGDVLATIRCAEIEPLTRVDGRLFGRWYRSLPPAERGCPAARFAAGIELAARMPLAASQEFEDASAGFRADGDVDGEVAVLWQDGRCRWWANDLTGLAVLLQRLTVLAARGSPEAATLVSIGAAADRPPRR